jgi:AP2-associated kinase
VTRLIRQIENVLSTPDADQHTRAMGLIFKLCDFGSTTFPASHPPGTKVEADAQCMDLNRHTTLQYRSPEMVEPMLGLAVGLPSGVSILSILHVELMSRRMGARSTAIQALLLYHAI